MGKLIFVSGALGIGKSHLLDTLKPIAKTICVDGLQREIGIRAFPYIAREEYYWWCNSFPERKENFDLVRLFRDSLRSFDPSLLGYDGNLVAAGCILALDWFRRPFKEAINQTCIRYSEDSVYKLRMEVPFDVHFRQIHKRASEVDYRSKEARTYPDVQSIRVLQAEHLRLYSYSWDSAASHDEAEARIRSLLNG